MKQTGLLVSGIVALVVSMAFVWFFPPTQKIVERTFQGAAGPTHTEFQQFLGSYSKGGNVVATTTGVASYTLLNHEWKANDSYISLTPNLNLTLTTMASSSAPLADLGKGESLEYLFYNASTTAASTVTFAAGTGIDLQEDEGETVIVNGLEIARLTFVKKNDTDVILWIEVGQVGD